MIAQRMSIFLLANSLLFFGFTSLFQSSPLKDTILKFIVPSLGMFSCILLVANGVRAARKLDKADKQCDVPLPKGFERFFASRRQYMWFAIMFFTLWSASLFVAFKIR